MKYDFKCVNSECSEFEKVKEYNIKISEYKIPKCEKCENEMKRVYSSFGTKTSDGIKTAK